MGIHAPFYHINHPEELMTKFKKLITALLCLVLAASFAACGAQEPVEESVASEALYTVAIQTAGSMALPGIDVYIYEDETLSELVQYGQTSENGFVSFTLPQKEGYAITLSGTAQGYEVAEQYPVTGEITQITLTSSLIQGENLSTANLGLGDVMYDFTVTTPEGQSVTLSDMLAEKDMVLLNFWYTTCTYCVAEFPFMEEAWKQYSDKVGIIALNPLEEDNAIASFKAQQGLNLTMAKCPAAWSNTFGVSGYPTSIVVDRHGVICLVEAGGITSLRPFVSIFDHFTGEQYQQTLFGSLSELVTAIKPNISMDTSEAVSAVFDGGSLDVTYRPETEGESAEYAWPFVITEQDGTGCLKASNQGIEDSYAILYIDAELKAGEAIGFEYQASTEKGCDILYVIVNDEPVYTISGYNEEARWDLCYPWVAQEDGQYEIALCYLKDSDTNTGDDTVYLRNLHIVSQDEISVPTYIPRSAATEVGPLEFEYADIFFNEADGYYHVGSENGPLLLADLMNYTMFNEEKTLWELTYNGDISVGGKSIYDDMVDYFSYASNSSLSGVCTVSQGLADFLQMVDEIAGFDSEDPMEWMKLCKYYEVYGTDTQLRDPIKGLDTSCAFEAVLGRNSVTYDRPIMPRGLLNKFVPAKSGVYRITSHSDSEHGVEGWIFSESRHDIYTYAQDERMNYDGANVSMVYYMEAGKSYYIDIAYWDIYEVGTIDFTIEYVSPELDLFRLCAPGYFTYDTNATGDMMYSLIAGGIDVVMGEDGYYHQDLGKDANGNQIYGSIIYADFTGLTPVFSQPIATVNAYKEDGSLLLDADGQPKMITGMIDMGGFDFSRTEDDLYILSVLEKFDGDEKAADDYLRQQWGEEYDANAEAYQLEDVFMGRYHGRGEDLTEAISAYLDKMITSGPQERIGCVPVDAELAEILQKLMDKYTFSGVDYSWTKLCYYYDHLGPNK